jgi:hypothetical protein
MYIHNKPSLGLSVIKNSIRKYMVTTNRYDLRRVFPMMTLIRASSTCQFVRVRLSGGLTMIIQNLVVQVQARQIIRILRIKSSLKVLLTGSVAEPIRTEKSLISSKQVKLTICER